MIIQLQLYGFNSQLYTNLSVAREFPGGVVAVSIMLQVSFVFLFQNGDTYVSTRYLKDLLHHHHCNNPGEG